jgi:hypothetical protein
MPPWTLGSRRVGVGRSGYHTSHGDPQAAEPASELGPDLTRSGQDQAARTLAAGTGTAIWLSGLRFERKSRSESRSRLTLA